MKSQPIVPPGAPGIRARWTSSAKAGIGTALGPKSHVWFTHSHGILNEVYYPDVDRACIRDCGIVVTDGASFISDEKRHAQSVVTMPVPGVPSYHLANTCNEGRYRIEKEIVTDPERDVVLQRIRFVPLQGTLAGYHVYVLLAPHLGNEGAGNTAWIEEGKQGLSLLASRGESALAVASSVPWLQASVGFVGTSDGWQDVMHHGVMTWNYRRAENGNVAIIGEVDLNAGEGSFVLALGFGATPLEANVQANASLGRDFSAVKETYVEGWRGWQRRFPSLSEASSAGGVLNAISEFVLRASESKLHPGGIIASLSVPWGFARGDDDLGGYHLIWPRDLVEAAGGFLAVGAFEDAARVLEYLRATQLSDGHWPQNMWLDGKPYWFGIQMDETAFPILLVDQAYREGAIGRKDQKRLWSMVRKAAGYIVLNGPVTQEDRWEEDPGYAPFTLAVEIASLLAAADLAEFNDEPGFATYFRETADLWNSNIEHWTYVTGTELAKASGVEGYYVRIAPPEIGEAASLSKGFIPIKNRPPGQSEEPAMEIISPDILALVRFGLRAPDDPRILNSVRVIDFLLKVETPTGPAWHRYNDDGYGEHEDGSPFDGTGIGRVWPLLTGERAHYELSAGRKDVAARLLGVMKSFANEGGMIPEQIWDSPDMPDRELFFGRPAGSAMPLVWAHAEYLKLDRSLRDGRVFDLPPQTYERYVVQKTASPHALWRFNHKCLSIPRGKILRIELLAAANVHWTADDWKATSDMATTDLGFGLHLAELPTGTLATGSRITFTFFWQEAGRWEGRDFQVTVQDQV